MGRLMGRALVVSDVATFAELEPVIGRAVGSSELGEGFAYCLGMFLAHEWKLFQLKALPERDEHCDVQSWFNGAADHLFGLIVPAAFSPQKRLAIEAFQERCLAYHESHRDYVRGERLTGERLTYAHAEQALELAKELLLQWDLMMGVPATRAEWR